MTTLSEMWYRYNLLYKFKVEMNKKGYARRDLYIIHVQLDLLEVLINIESKNMLGDLLTKKTYYRLLKSINRGIEYLPDIIENPEQYILNPIEKDKEAWISDNVLIFQTKKNDYAVFSKISRKNIGFKYTDNKFQ